MQLHRRVYRARLGPKHPWVKFGTDYPEACKAYAAWKQSRGVGRTVAWLLDKYVGEVCLERVAAGEIKPRTARDYLRDAPVLKKGLGHIPIAGLGAAHVTAFGRARAKSAPTHVRNELACLSAALSWALAQNPPLVTRNVCHDARKPPKRVRQRLVTDAEYVAVYEAAGPSVRLAMALAVRTLALPGDVLAFGPHNIVGYDDGRRTLRFRRGKTDIGVEVEVVGELAAALAPFLEVPKLRSTFVSREDGTAYQGVEGMGAMFRRACVKAGVRDFGLRDLRAKGATDMYRAGLDIRQIQRLLGHKSVVTTEVYLKGLLAEIVRPNERPILGLVKG